MRRLIFILSSAALVFFCLPAAAQEQAAPQTAPSAFAAVSGRVTCGDTGHPARFAAVQLIPEKPQPNQALDLTNVKDEKDMANRLAKSMFQARKNTGLSAVSTIDGSFEMPQVPPGTYYIVAELSGYLSPLSELRSVDMFTAGDDALKIIQAQTEKVVVQSAPVRVDVRLERGGSLSGVIRYDDGSPAAGVRPVRMILQEDGKWKGDAFHSSELTVITDDRGHYRISGLAPGKYAVKAELPTNQMITGLGGAANIHSNRADALVVFSGGVFREKDIKPIQVGAGEDVDGIDLVFPIDNLHVVSGTVTAKTDNHSVNSAWVSLKDPETKAMLRSTMIEEDGSFKFNYIPEGQYELEVSHAGDADKNVPGGAFIGKPTFLKNYQDANLPIEVKGDLTGLMVQVADQTAAEAPAKPPTP
jgi:hypothetical protein